MLTKCIECWHERVALFTAFCLVDRARPTCSIMPHKPRGCRVRLPHERERGASTGQAGKSAEHCQAADGVKSPDPIQGSGSAGLEGVCKSFGAGTCGEGELKRLTGLLQVGQENLGKGTGHKPTKEVTDHKRC